MKPHESEPNMTFSAATGDSVDYLAFWKHSTEGPLLGITWDSARAPWWRRAWRWLRRKPSVTVVATWGTEDDAPS